MIWTCAEERKEILDKECLKWSCQAGGKEKGSRGRCSDGLCDNKDQNEMETEDQVWRLTDKRANKRRKIIQRDDWF